MPRLARAEDHPDGRIVDPDDDTLSLVTFRVARLRAGDTLAVGEPGHEHCVVPLSGRVDVACEAERFEGVGGRSGVFDGLADSVYLPAATPFELVAAAPVEVAIAGGRTEADPAHAPFRVTPDEVEEVDVGSVDTHSRRRIRHVLGQRQHGRVGRLLVSELYADPGCWSGYPPHKHDTDDGDAETDHEELYHYRFDPDTGFGTQSCYAAGEPGDVHRTRHGDTFLLDRGYHPTSTSPGHRGYILTVLVGRTRRGLVQRFDPRHAHLMDAIPGLQGMRDAFR